MGSACSTNREKRNAYRILVGKAVRKQTTRKTRRRWIILKWILGWGGILD
jgi:hypothetical protein